MTNDTKRRITASISLAVSGFMFSSVPVFAQTVADAARQERERRSHAAHAAHVYTNEDLKRPQILAPEDRARVNDDGSATDAALTPQTQPADNAAKKAPANALSARHVGPPTLKNATPSNANAAPAIDSIPFVPNSGFAIAAASNTPGFPAATQSNPRSAAKSAVPIPVVNLPMQLMNATPLASPNESVVFPMLSPSNFATPRSASRASAVPAPVVTYPAPLNSPIANPAVSVALPAELVATPWLAAPKTQDVSNVEAPAMPSPSAAVLFAPAQQISIGTPADLVSAAAPLASATAERIASVEPPAVAPLAAPANSFDTPAPLQAPLAPSTPATKPMVEQTALSPEASEVRTVIVQTGDSLWKLAERYLGKGERWVELAKLNPQLARPGVIHPGDPVRLPAPLPANAKQVVIRRGDTLWSVARVELGSGLAFSCVAHANNLQSPDVILAGETLVLPADCSR